MSPFDSLTTSINWSPVDGERLLIAGSERDLPVIRTVLATLPAKARGQVFVEVDTADRIEPLDAPGRVMVCWVVRDRGQSLRRSVDAWLSEMLPVDGLQEHTLYAWIAAEGAARSLSSN